MGRYEGQAGEAAFVLFTRRDIHIRPILPFLIEETLSTSDLIE